MLRGLRTRGQQTPEELIDRYRSVNRPIRDLLVDYLRERQPALDYTSLVSLSYYLGKRFWADLEPTIPGIDNLHLSRRGRRWLETAAPHVHQDEDHSPAGERNAVTVERINYRECLTPVRALYLDLAHWAVEDPGRWGRWVVPCPVGEEEVNRQKAKRRRKSRMDARTRRLLPALPVLVRAVDRATRPPPGRCSRRRHEQNPVEAFTVAGVTLIRAVVAARGPRNHLGRRPGNRQAAQPLS